MLAANIAWISILWYTDNLLQILTQVTQAIDKYLDKHGAQIVVQEQGYFPLGGLADVMLQYIGVLVFWDTI